MARDVDGRGGLRWVLLFVLVAGAAWVVWSRRSTGTSPSATSAR